MIKIATAQDAGCEGLPRVQLRMKDMNSARVDSKVIPEMLPVPQVADDKTGRV
jgi:hypothetical protein